jgi:hypothetical protein
MKKILSPILALGSVLVYCAAYTALEPVGQGHLDANISLGGPIISAFGGKIPLPYTAMGFNYGLSRRTNLHGNFHLLPLAYKMIGLDGGIAWFPVENCGSIPTLGIQSRLLGLASIKSGINERVRIYPVLSASAAWRVSSGTLYLGFDLIVPLSSQDFDNEASSALFSPFWGYRWSLGAKNRLLTELKWHGVNVRSDQLAVDYLFIGAHGAITTLLSIERSF